MFVWLQRILLVVVSTIIALGIAEYAARKGGLPPGFGRFISTQDTPHRMVDGVVLWGVRNPRYDRADVERAIAEPNIFNIVALGDSILFGVNLSKEQTYMEHTRRLLAERSPRKIEILNLAVPGYGTLQENAALKELDQRLQPDLTVVHYWGDDVLQYRALGPYVVDFGDITEDGRTVIRPFPLPPDISDYLLVHSRLYDFLSGVALNLTRQPQPRDWTRVSKPLTEIYQRTARGGGRMLIIASVELNGPRAKSTADIAQLHAFADSLGIEVIDLAEWLTGVDVQRIAMDGCHFNAEGHRLLGERFTEYLLQHDLKEPH